MSKLVAPASLGPATLIVRVVVPGCIINVEVPSTAAFQATSLPVIAKAPIFVKAPVRVIDPVPASRVRPRFEPATEPFKALAREMLPLLARLSSTTVSAMARLTPDPPKEM